MAPSLLLLVVTKQQQQQQQQPLVLHDYALLTFDLENVLQFGYSKFNQFFYRSVRSLPFCKLVSRECAPLKW